MIDARLTMGGVERYTFELGRRLLESGCDERIILYGRKSIDRFKPATTIKGCRLLLRPVLGNIKRILTDQVLLPLAAHRSQADLIHSTNYLVPLRTKKPVVVTCHDLTLIDFFATEKKGPMKYYERWLMKNGLRKAAHVITPSHSVAAELRQRYELPEEKVSAIYPPLPAFCTATHASLPRADLSIPPPPFFLSVGTIEPRKNLSRLLQGWAQSYKVLKIPLLLVGPYGWGQRQLVKKQLGTIHGLHWLGCVNDTTLSLLYRQATAVIQYSQAEGFDYPAAEALCTGTPVVASDIPVHREVLGNCGIFSPHDAPQDLAAKLSEVGKWNADQRADFIHKSRKQADRIRRYSSTELYLALYRRISYAPTRSPRISS